MAIFQIATVAAVGAGLALGAPAAAFDGVAGGAVLAVSMLGSGAYALGGGVLGADSAAQRAVIAVVGRWVLALGGLLILSARDGAAVWAVATGAVVAHAAALVATMTFKRV